MNTNNIKPTMKKPTPMGKDLEKKYSNALYAKGINPLTEVDKNLMDDQFSQKKKIWDLAKMEGLVKNDPKLSSIYEKMSTQGREKYGYHYNETIMNILFNEYVLNSPTYLVKYRNATPVDKKRSRKKDSDSGYDIELKKNIDRVIMDRNDNSNTDVNGTDESTTASSSGAYAAKAGLQDKSHNVYEEDEINEHHLETRDEKVDFIQKHEPQKYDVDKLESMSDQEVDDAYNRIEKEIGLTAYQNESENDNNAKRNNKINYIMHYYDDLADYFYDIGDYDDVIEYLEGLDDRELDKAYKNVKIEMQSLDETTTATSSGQYSTPHAFASSKSKPRHSNEPAYDGGEMVKENYLINPSRFEKIFESVGRYMNEETEEEMKDSILNYMIKDNPNDKNDIEKWVDSLESESIETIYNELGDNLNEEAKSEAQQRFMGMVYAYKKGELDDNEVSDEVKDAADDMTKKEAKKYASTKHDDIPDKVKNEDEEIVGGLADGKDPSQFDSKQIIKGIKIEMEHTNDWKEALEIAMDHLMEIPDYYDRLEDMEDNAEGDKNEGIEDIMDTETSMTNDSEQSMADDMQNLNTGSGMIGEDGHCRADEVPVEGVPAGEKGSCRKKTTKIIDKKQKNMEDNKEKTDNKEKLGGDDEGKQKENPNDPNKYNIEYRKKRQQDKEKRLKQHNKEEKKKEDAIEESLNFMENYEKYMKSLDEERKSTSMLNLDKIKKQTAELTDKELMKNLDDTMHDIDMGETYDEQQEVLDNPDEMLDKIEKEKMKDHDFESFENVGNSTNMNNKEIPKRNATDDEKDMIDKERGLGMHDIVYENEPSERFEERMKDDMGDEFYEIRQKKMDHRAKAPMYNKDSMPTDDGIEKNQYNKYKSGYAETDGIDESIVTGKYKNESGQNKFIDFMISECRIIDDVNDELIPLNLDGMGNRYTQNVHESSMRQDMDTFDFYLNQMTNKVVKKQSTGRGMMNESKETQKNGSPINEEAMNKMKYLWNYEGKSFVDTKETKKYRGF